VSLLLVKLNLAPATEFNVESETLLRFITPAKKIYLKKRNLFQHYGTLLAVALCKVRYEDHIQLSCTALLCACLHVCVCACLHVCKRVCVCVCVCVCMCVCVSMCVHKDKALCTVVMYKC
jgi:hypothetical protein